MGMRTVNDPYGDPAVLVDHVFSNSYEVVRKVATNIDFVKMVSTLFDADGAVIANLHKRYVAIEGQTDFVLPVSVSSENDINVFVNNLWKSPVTSFVTNDNLLSLQNPLNEGDFVDVMIISDASIDAMEKVKEDSIIALEAIQNNTQAIFDATVLLDASAQKWAENPENVEVSAGKYSALHHSAKASAQQELAKNAATNAASDAAIAEAWAEGTAPGGAGTKSAREWSIEASAKADDAEAARDAAVAAAEFRAPSMSNFLSRSDVTLIGSRWRVDTGEVMDVVAAGSGHYNHPVSGMGLLAIEILGQEVTLAQVGGDHTANGKVPATARTDSSALLTKLLLDSSVNEIVIPEGAWRFDSPVNITTLDHDVTIRGAGIGRTAIEIYQTSGYGISIAAALDDLYKYQVKIEDMSVYRVGAGSYAGSARPQTVRLERLRDPVMRRIDTYNGIGFGLLMSRCLRPTIEHCLSHDSSVFETGTDAIHFSRCVSPRALYNQAWNVGDDLLSFGSYTIGGNASEVATTDVLAIGNSCWGGSRDGGNTGHGSNSGVKLYGNVSGARIIGQYSEECNAGGIYFADHNGVHNGLIEDVQVIGGQMVNCRGEDAETAGALRWRFNPKDGADYTSIARRISFKDVEAIGCRTFFYNNAFPTSYGEHYLEDWSFEGCSHVDAAVNVVTSGSYGMKFFGMRGRLEISDMLLKNVIGAGIFLESTSGQWDDLDRLVMHRVSIDGWNKGTPSASNHAIWVRPTNLPVDIRDVDIRGQNVANGIAAASRLIVNNARPDSVITGITGAGPGSNNISGSYRTNDARMATAVPSTGTWQVGDFVGNTSTSGAAGWRARTNGTFGTLTGVTASGAAGDFSVTVSALDTLKVGEYITAAAGLSASGVQVVGIDGLIVHLNSALTATISDEAVSYYTPTFKTEANYTA